MVVLHKLDLVPHSLVEGTLVEALHEEPALITEHLRFDQEHIRNGGGCDLHQNTCSLRTFNKYWP